MSPANSDPATKKAPPPTPPAAKPLIPIGTDLGPYRIVAELGTGGMGMLYVGEHRSIGRRMAIKVLHPNLARRTDIVRRFFDEARSVNTISHEHIVEIYDFVANPSGLNYMVMELLEGRDLQQARAKEGPFAVARTLNVIAQVASALAAAHAKSIVHRDIKPENVFLTRRAGQDDFVKLLDFGLAKLSESTREARDRTRAGTVLGTPEYMSPEQARGTTVDARADIYSLGLLFHWMLFDRLPFESRDPEELRVLREKGTPGFASRSVGGEPLPPRLNEIFLRCVQQNPSRRYQTCAELETELRRSLAPGSGGSLGERTNPAVSLELVGRERSRQKAARASGSATQIAKVLDGATWPNEVTRSGPAVDAPRRAEQDVTQDVTPLELPLKPAAQAPPRRSLPSPPVAHVPPKLPREKPMERAVTARRPAVSLPLTPTTDPHSIRVRRTTSRSDRRREPPWLALALTVCLAVLGYAFYRVNPLGQHRVLPQPPSAPYGASLLKPPSASPPSPAGTTRELELPAAVPLFDPEGAATSEGSRPSRPRRAPGRTTE